MDQLNFISKWKSRSDVCCKRSRLKIIFSEKASAARMAFRRPPPDVDRMTSLRVGNLPYSVVIEVSVAPDIFTV